ncbi:MAG: hypothetical protein ABSD47_07290 [Candidatus Methylomirabilota bacterium]|jgi:hypothetical protein
MTPGIQGGGRQYIHYDPDRTDYSITPEELATLESANSNIWKEVCLVCGPLGLSCLLNALASTKEPFTLTLSLFLNYLFGILGVGLAIVFGIAWCRSRKTFRRIIEGIKKKPKMQVTLPNAVVVGSLPAAAFSFTPGSPSKAPSGKGMPAEPPVDGSVEAS